MVEDRRGNNSRKTQRTTAGKRPRERLRRAREDLHLTTLNRLVQVLSHETRNILGSFATCLELLRRSTQLNQDDRELLSILQTGSRRLNEIAEQFAAFGPPSPLRLEPVELTALIAELIERLRADERCSPALDVRVEYAAAVEPIAADRKLLGRCLWNLILNAAQATGDRGTLEIKTKQSNGKIEIQIRDTGPGIATSLRDKIFEPLFTTKTRATGLGLTIARRIAAEHGGELKLQTTDKGGSAFALVLPLRRDDNIASTETPLRRAARIKRTAGSKKHNGKSRRS